MYYGTSTDPRHPDAALRTTGLSESCLPTGKEKNSEIEATTERRLLIQAYRNVKPMLFVNMSAGLCAIFVLVSTSARFGLLWLSCISLLTVIRWAGNEIYMRKLLETDIHHKDFLKVTRAAQIAYGGGLVLAALLWNALLLEAVRASYEAKFFVTIIMAALAGGAIGVSAPLRCAGRAYITAILAPAAFILATAPEPNLLLSGLTFIFWIVMLIGHNNNHVALRNAFTFQSQNMILVDELRNLNASLEHKVMERTRDLETAASRDPLTNLPNRRGFREMLAREAGRAHDERRKLSVGVIDLDGFKPVNDAFGHATGDQLLQEVGQRLQACVGARNYVARLGGDEFGFIVTEPTDEEALKRLGTRICSELARPYHLTGVVAEIGASIGLSTLPDHSEQIDELCAKADYALYHAKQVRKGTAIIFSENHEAEIRELARMEQVLRRADFSREIYAEFQPIKDCRTGQVYGFEALARWNSPELGKVPPGLFIRAAERSGLILDLTRHLLTHVLRTASRWPRDIRVSVNLSARDIASMDAVNELVQIVQDSPIDPGRIDFEITETALVCDFDQAQAALNRLHEIGTRIALDDFGTGHSSLSHLRLLPLDKLKVDTSFVADIMTHQTSEDIVRTLIRLCENMRIECVVEGIETRDQLQKVSDMGASLLQGYYLARPMPEADIAAYLLSSIRTVEPLEAAAQRTEFH